MNAGAGEGTGRGDGRMGVMEVVSDRIYTSAHCTHTNVREKNLEKLTEDEIQYERQFDKSE